MSAEATTAAGIVAGALLVLASVVVGLAWAVKAGDKHRFRGEAEPPYDDPLYMTAENDKDADQVIEVGSDDLCVCCCGDKCPLGKVGSEARCRKNELLALGVVVEQVGKDGVLRRTKLAGSAGSWEVEL